VIAAGKIIDLEAVGMRETQFSPAAIYYDGPSGKFLVDSGNYFRTYRSKSPVLTGLARHFVAQGADRQEAKEFASEAVRDAEVDRHVEWSGNLAGYRKGLITSADGKPMLVLTSPAIPDPVRGHAPIISGLLRQAFPDADQRDIFTGWLASGYKAVRAGVHQPAPMLCIAGKPGAGKSLLAYITKLVLGGRSANPSTEWFGELPWNDDLVGAELLLLDDCQGSFDIRARNNFAAKFKEAIYSGGVSLRKRHVSTTIDIRPVWRVLPPINSDTEDKIILLKVSPVVTPIATSNPDERLEFQAAIKAELPAFAAYLQSFVLRPELAADSRSGIIAWRHPELCEAIESLRPEVRLEELIQSALSGHLWQNVPEVLTACDVETRLLDLSSPVREQARKLLTWGTACGSYLGKLADSGSEIVKPAEYDGHKKRRRFLVTRPSDH
jgi:hypothetical protein